MFDNLTDRLSATLRKLRGQGRLTEQNIQDTLREVRMALLEADVALPVVKDFIEQVKQRAVGQEVSESLTPGQAFIKIVHDELVKVMGAAAEGLNFACNPPAIILMAGLQGAGKTTTVAKLARWIKENTDKKKIAVVSADVYRPAAIEQLKTLASEVGVEWVASEASQDPLAIVQYAVQEAKRHYYEVLLVDTAGRLAIDQQMMAEIKAIEAAIRPIETLFVVDSMTGQDAARTAKAFHEELPLTGVILTKTDGDARGGAALSVRHVTGKPIKFLGTGEKSAALELFHPDRVASRILGMGDVLTLIEEVQKKVDHTKAEKLASKLKKGREFDFEDFREQIVQINRMGGITSLMDKLPGMAEIPQQARDKADPEREMRKVVAMIDSMTRRERRYPAVINPSRKKRIAAGSGMQIQDVNKLLKQFEQMQKMMKKMQKGGLQKMMRGLGGAMKGRPPFM